MDLCQPSTVFPSWDQGHCRLNYSRMEYCDHLKLLGWKGYLVASSCNLKVVWFLGRTPAEQILRVHHVNADFNEVFRNKNVDMLHPFRDGIYPGICTDPDPSILTVPESLPNI
jgi:hypothetical protein